MGRLLQVKFVIRRIRGASWRRTNPTMGRGVHAASAFLLRKLPPKETR